MAMAVAVLYARLMAMLMLMLMVMAMAMLIQPWALVLETGHFAAEFRQVQLIHGAKHCEIQCRWCQTQSRRR